VELCTTGVNAGGEVIEARNTDANDAGDEVTEA
jgi:hypothetical protein